MNSFIADLSTFPHMEGMSYRMFNCFMVGSGYIIDPGLMSWDWKFGTELNTIQMLVPTNFPNPLTNACYIW